MLWLLIYYVRMNDGAPKWVLGCFLFAAVCNLIGSIRSWMVDE